MKQALTKQKDELIVDCKSEESQQVEMEPYRQK
jgi:hypothetical protein